MAGLMRTKVGCLCRFEVRFGEPPLQRMRSNVQAFKPGRRGDRSPDSKFRKTKCRMSILTIRHPALQSMCSKD
jgi:hypothetical protein